MRSMVGYADSDYVEMLDGQKFSSAPQSLMHKALLVENTIIIYCRSPQIAINFLKYCLLAGYVPSNERKNALSVLCGTNRKLYHVTYYNNDGKSFRLFMLGNLIRSQNEDTLRKSFGGKNAHESIMNALRECENMGIMGITIGSAAMNAYASNIGYGRFNKIFPTLDNEMERKIRSGYMGGYMYAKDGEYLDAKYWDCNSMYPYILSEKPLPFGEAVRFDGKYESDASHKLYIQNMTFRADLKDGGIPFLSVPMQVNGYRDLHVESTHGYINMYLTNIDIHLLYDNYDVSVYEWSGGWKFKKSQGFFYDYVDSYFQVKKLAKGAKRTLSKNMLNSLVGKFGVLPKDNLLVPYINDSDKIGWKISASNTQQSKHYLPVSMFVTSYGRSILFDALRANMDNVVYANTDGFITVGKSDASGIVLHKTNLGEWKCEAEYKKLVVLGIGMYQGLKIDDTFDTVTSGITRTTPIPWLQFEHGGVILDDNNNRVVIQ